MNLKGKEVVVIGGGLAGLSAASLLVDQGAQVTLLEKEFYLGGRASSTLDRKMHDPVPVGPHIFVKGYKFFNQFLKKIGAHNVIVWQRNLFIELFYKKKHHQFKMSDIPHSFGTLHKAFLYPFIGFRDSVSNIRVIFSVFFSRVEKLEKLDHMTAFDYLLKKGVTNNSINKMWRFFVLSMLNVPIELCSAAEFGMLVKAWLNLAHREIGFAKVGLGDVYSNKAKDYIEERGGTIHQLAQVSRVVFKEKKVDYVLFERKGKTKKKIRADFYISTLPPTELRELLPTDIMRESFFRHLNAFEGVSYMSVNLWFNSKITNKKFWALLNDSETPEYMNLDFYDKSNIYKTRKKGSYITSNVIYSKPYESMSDVEIVDRTLKELKIAIPDLKGFPIHSHVHRIPYVIYAPYPGMRKHKLPHKTPYRNFYLCGDWTTKDITQSMEAAVRSAHTCVDELVESTIGDNIK